MTDPIPCLPLHEHGVHQSRAQTRAQTHVRALALSLLMLTVAGTVQAQGTAPAPAAAPAPGTAIPGGASDPGARIVRKELNDILDAARSLFRDEKYDDAAYRLEAAEAMANLTPFERASLERVRAAVAARQERYGVSARALEAALATGAVTGTEELDVMASLASLAMRDKDYARAITWSQRYAEKGGADDSVQLVRLEALRFSGDERGALQGWKARRAALERAGARFPEPQWRVLWALQRRHEPAEAGATLEGLAQAYPRPEYFAELAAAASQVPDLTERALVSLYRLLRVVGALNTPAMALEMAERAVRIGYPGEAAAVLEDAQRAGALPGNRADDLARVREAVQRALASDERDRPASEAAARQASDGTRLADLGWANVAALPVGAPPERVRPGLELLEQGVAKGGLRRDSEARLNLAIAQLSAGRREDARSTVQALAKQLEAAGKPDPMASAVRLWGLLLAAPPMLPPR